MATYKEIQRRVKQADGFVPKTCWIADVKSSFGLTCRQAPNRLSGSRRKYPCPPGKRASIERALAYFGMVRE